MTFFSLGCTDSTSFSPASRWHMIAGRDEVKEPIYRVKVPLGWIRKDSLPDESLADTTKPLCEFYIQEGTDIIRITIHNFPSDHLNDRIPPSAQIARWQRQFQQLYPEQSSIVPQAFSGFSGLLFQGTGSINGIQTTVMGWSMQMAPAHYQALSYPETPEEKHRYPQMRADFTIKMTGPKDLMYKHMHSLKAFARSFELIEDIPT